MTAVEIATTFAQALVDGDFARASALLAPELALGPTELRDEFHAMLDTYADHRNPAATHIVHDARGLMFDWPDKRSGDVAWVYVGICGESFVEAVTVVIGEVGGGLRIRELEWGRP